MTSGSAIPPAHKSRWGPGGVVVLRLALRWALSVLAFVSLGQSVRMAVIRMEELAPSLRAVVSGISTARSAMARAGIHASFPSDACSTFATRFPL